MTERKENQMTTNRKVLTGLAVLIVLSLLVMPASVFAQEKARGSALTSRTIKNWKTRRMRFQVNEPNGDYPARGSMFVFDPKCENLLWSIPRVKCVDVDGDTAYFAGRGAGKKRGKFVLVVARDGGQGAGFIEVYTTRSKRYFRYWCNNYSSIHGIRHRWDVMKGSVNVPY
jgi:hypothetical protein